MIGWNLLILTVHMVSHIKARVFFNADFISTSISQMKFNLKQLLALSVFFGSVKSADSVDCRATLIKRIDAIAITGNITDFEKNDTRKTIIRALNNPSCLIKNKYDFSLDCKTGPAHNFYDISFVKEKDRETFKAHCKNNSTLDSLDKNIVQLIEYDYKEKKKFLEAIMSKIPIVSEYRKVITGEFDLSIKSHIDKFIEDSLVFDGTRLSFSNLHKAVESIKNACKVERKAVDGIKAAYEMLKVDNLVKLEIDDKFKIKMPNEKTGAGSSGQVKPKNIIDVAIKASDKSTSSPIILGFILVGSLLISMILLLFKAYTAEETKDEDEMEE